MARKRIERLFRVDNKDRELYVYERAMAMSERHNKRLLVALIICIIIIFTSNAMWLYQWCQYDYVDDTQTSTSYEQDGSTNIIGDMNDVTEDN